MQKKYSNRPILSYVILCLCFVVDDAEAFSEQEMIDEQISAIEDEWKPIVVSGDALPWEVFTKTAEIEECTQDDEGYDDCIIKPDYSDAIKALDGKEVTLMGFMFPLEPSETQKVFLIGPYPLSCPFHYHIGPSQVVEVLAEEGFTFSYDPITVKGILKLRFNEETGVFYYLENAK
jgi:hypothetical protein